jgi:hypothetical protein
MSKVYYEVFQIDPNGRNAWPCVHGWGERHRTTMGKKMIGPNEWDDQFCDGYTTMVRTRVDINLEAAARVLESKFSGLRRAGQIPSKLHAGHWVADVVYAALTEQRIHPIEDL